MKLKYKLKLYAITLLTYLSLFIIEYILVNYLVDFITNSYSIHFYVIFFLVLFINPFITWKIVNRFKYEKGLYKTDMGKKAYMSREVNPKSYKESE